MIFKRNYLSENIYHEKEIVFITCLFWLIAKLISWKAWTAYRLFPLVPAFDFLKNLPAAYHLVLFFVSLFCLVILVIKPSVQIAVILIVAELLSLIADQNRWQPWEYQYLFIISMFWLKIKKTKQFYLAVMFIIGSVYFYSGVSKLNPGFLYAVWNDMIIHRFLGIKTVINSPMLYHAGYAIGLTEIVCAIGLFFKNYKKICALVLIIMHCLNLVVLGPFGINYNLIVWPWNVAMIAYLYIFFIKFPVDNFNILVVTAGWNKLVLIFWGLLPALNFFGRWDNYLSSALYTGRIKEMVICLKDPDDTVIQSLEPFYSADYKNICDGDKTITVTQWAIKELRVPVYPERRVYLEIKKSFQRKYPSIHARFYYYSYYLDKKEEIK